MEWLLSSLKCQLWINPAHQHIRLLWERGKWEREKLRQGSCSVLLKGRRPQISWAGCFIPHLIPLCKTLSCAIATSAFVGQWCREWLQGTAPKTPFGSSCVICQHPDSPQLPLSETIPPPTSNIHFLEGREAWFLWRGGRQCLARMWEEADHERSW